MNDKKPADWDWVTERANCSIPVMFETLRELAKRDTDTRNGQFSRQHKMFLYQESEDIDVRQVQFSVVDTRSGRRIKFRREESGIVVGGMASENVRVSLTLTDTAGCRLKLESLEIEPWQLMKRALESLFFDS